MFIFRGLSRQSLNAVNQSRIADERTENYVRLRFQLISIRGAFRADKPSFDVSVRPNCARMIQFGNEKRVLATRLILPTASGSATKAAPVRPKDEGATDRQTDRAILLFCHYYLRRGHCWCPGGASKLTRRPGSVCPLASSHTVQRMHGQCEWLS